MTLARWPATPDTCHMLGIPLVYSEDRSGAHYRSRQGFLAMAHLWTFDGFVRGLAGSDLARVISRGARRGVR